MVENDSNLKVLMNNVSKNFVVFIGFLFCVAAGSGARCVAIETNKPLNPVVKEARPVRALADESLEPWQCEAVRFLVEEAASVARELQLPEPETITVTNSRITVLDTNWWSRPPRMVGNVITESFAYYFSIDCKLSFVESTKQHERIMEWSKMYEWEMEKLDTDAAIRLAERWLRAAHMDVDALNAECARYAEPNRYYNSGIRGGYFIPIYDVRWSKKVGRRDKESVASVSLLMPEKRLISLRVENPKYNLRPSFVCTNFPVLPKAENGMRTK